MFFYSESSFIEKFLRESQILAKTEMTRNKNRLFGRHFESLQHFSKNAELWFFIMQTYMVHISFQNSGGKVVFLGFHGRGTHLGHQLE